jgi:hypothetical protein
MSIRDYRLAVPEWIWNRKTWVYYLIINDSIKELGEVAKVAPDARFFEMVSHHVREYVENGVKPPDAIATAILNVADDTMAGREVTMRAGDYIALQTYARSKK